MNPTPECIVSVLKYGSDSLDWMDQKVKDYTMQQVMVRIKDPKRSLEFYVHHLGMNLIVAREV